MSLFNALFGESGLRPLIVGVLGTDDFGRYRDCWVEMSAGKPRIAVYTRNGGGNRDDYEDVFDTLASHPLYLYDEDSDFDCTYATIYFKVPENLEADFTAIALKEPRDPGAEFAALIAKLNDPAKAGDPQVVRAMEVGKPIVAAIEKAMDGSGPPIVTI